MLATWGPNHQRVEVIKKAKRIVCWFSCGAASAVAAKMALDEWRDVLPVEIVYCDTGSEHPDNSRFMADCVRWFNHPVSVIKNEKYTDIFDVFRQRRYIKDQYGAPCTRLLKIAMRQRFERFDDAQVFGFDFEEAKRVNDFIENNPEVMVVAPLIERKINKLACFEILTKAGIELPIMYKLGYQNNNCIGCVKGGMGYWNKIRRDFPETFAEFAKLEREIGHSINSEEIKINGQRKKLPVYLDELHPKRGRYIPPTACGATGCETTTLVIEKAGE